jgi:hypothetical protein
MGDIGFKPVRGATAAGGDFEVAAALPLALSSSGFFPSFQKSLFRGFAAVSSIIDSAVVVRVDGAEESCSRGAAESFDSVLGALIRSLTEGSFDDMSAI